MSHSGSCEREPGNNMFIFCLFSPNSPHAPLFLSADTLILACELLHPISLQIDVSREIIGLGSNWVLGGEDLVGLNPLPRPLPHLSGKPRQLPAPSCLCASLSVKSLLGK